MVTTDVTRESHPNLWSFLALVSATMDVPMQTYRVPRDPIDVSVVDHMLGQWSFDSAIRYAGVRTGWRRELVPDHVFKLVDDLVEAALAMP